MENQIQDLNSKKTTVTGENVALKNKFESLKKLEKEVFTKLCNLDEQSNQRINLLENDYMTGNRERLELEANNRLQEMESKNELQKNQELEYTIKSGAKLTEQKQDEFNKQLQIIEQMTKEKIAVYESTNETIKQTEAKSNEEPFFKIELEKNAGYKKKIKELEETIMEGNNDCEVLDAGNEYMNKKKEDVINERKRLINLNDELRREIEAKKQISDIRIQKKVKENNSEEIKNLENHLQGVIKNIGKLEGKVEKEIEKIRIFSAEIIKLNIELRHKEEKKEEVIVKVDEQYKDIQELNDKNEGLKATHVVLKEKVGIIIIMCY